MARGGSVGSGGSRGFDRGRGGPMKRSGGNTEARQGDWICDECGNNNFSFRVGKFSSCGVRDKPLIFFLHHSRVQSVFSSET